MDFIFKLSDNIQDFSGYVEVMQLSERFDKKITDLEEIVKVENQLVNGLYKMTLEDLIQVLMEAGMEHERINTPLLPHNCIRHIWLNRSTLLQEVIIEVPKMKWDITYHNQLFEQVGFPRLLFKYTVAGTNVKINTITALKDNGTLKDETPLYHFPFSHVDMNGNVCMGSNTLPAIQSITQLSNLHMMFFSAPFGDDYGVKTSSGKNLRELFTQLSNNDFNDEWLLDKKQILLNL